MAVVRESVVLDASPQQVWDFLVDWTRQGEWIPATTVRPLNGSAGGVGDRIEGWTGVGFLGLRDPMEIRVWQPPHLLVMRHLGAVVRGAGAFELSPVGSDRCKFTWSEWIELPWGPVGRLLWVLARPVARISARVSLRRLARALRRVPPRS